MSYDRILFAHFLSRKSIIFHGSSGFGKSSSVYAFAKNNEFGIKFEVVEKRTCYVDPLEIMLPIKNEEEKLIDAWPARWLHRLASPDCPPTILFLDEFNRPSSSQTFSLFTELLLDRSINGTIKLSDNVLIVGACNLTSEDIGVMEIPDAVLKRVTNIAFIPDEHSIISNMPSKLARETLKNNSKILDKPEVPEFALNGNARQINTVAELAEIKYNEAFVLNEDDVGIVARGRLGLEKGNLMASAIFDVRNKKKFRLPREVKPENFEQIFECEDNGLALEVITLLKDAAANESNHRNIADYLLQYATPEVVRAVKETNLVLYSYPKDEYPLDKNGKPYVEQRKTSKEFGKPIKKTGEPWQLIAVRIGKIKPKVGS